MKYLKANMQQEQNWFAVLTLWLGSNWKEISGFLLASQLIDRFFKWLTKRSEARIKELMQTEIKETVSPEITRLAQSIDSLKESVWALKNKIS